MTAREGRGAESGGANRMQLKVADVPMREQRLKHLNVETNKRKIGSCKTILKGLVESNSKSQSKRGGLEALRVAGCCGDEEEKEREGILTREGN